ncbi:hypothetical protein [Neptunicoccus cionae]|uniref:hypothetical protein n=1 Tax=Neptunicoccus cionae TaxID=2035344 RepID=UPI00166356DB|nr:hypothetical protein [Amylibacter cionae]
MDKTAERTDMTVFKEIFDAAFQKAGTAPSPDDWTTCVSIVEIRRTSLALAEQYREQGDRLKVKRLEEKAQECEQVFADLAAYLAEERAA